MTQSYCMKCMRKLDGSPVCSRCGYDNSRPSHAQPYHIAPGTILEGKYLIGNVIGEGGFGITYIGLNTTLSKRVAIKEFYPSGAANRTGSEDVIVTRGKESFFQKGVQRFLEEAKNVATFGEEDGIVDIVDYFQANNTAYMVMEYLEGETLKQYIERNGLFPVNQIISLMIPLMRSLAAVHSQGVVHRDISPDNIMYHRLKKLKLMDFGSARYYTNEERQMSIVLKQGFAPEEQYRSNGVQGPFTDVYALCATIYTCITGKVPVNSVERLVSDTLNTPDIPTLINELTTETGTQEAQAPSQKPLNQSRVKTILEQPVAEAPRPTARTKTAPSQYQNQSAPNSYSQTPGYQNSYAPNSYNPNSYNQNSYNPNSYNPNSYNPDSYNPNSYSMPPQPPKKSVVPKVLAITIPAVVVIAAVIIIVIALNSGNNDSMIVFDSSTPEPASTSPQPTFSFSSDDDSSSSQTSDSGEGLSLEQAKANGAALKDYFFDNILSYDDQAEDGQSVKSLGIYYVDKKTDYFKLIYYVYQNVSGSYYRAVSVYPEDLSVKDGKIVASQDSFDADEPGSTLNEALTNSYFLDSSNSDIYQVTQVY